MRIDKFFVPLFLIIISSLLVSCAQHKPYTTKTDTSYYPFLAEDQYEFFHRQNQISTVPATLAVPPHEIGTLEYDLNAESWWGSWPDEGLYLNHFIAQHAKDILGCGPLPEGTRFTLEPGIYTYKKQKISVSTAMTWELITNLRSICLTKILLPSSYYENDSLYWKLPYSQNKIFSS